MPEIHIYLVGERTAEQKKKLMAALTDAVVTSIGSERDSIIVQIMEAPLIDKMKGGVTFAERRKK